MTAYPTFALMLVLLCSAFGNAASQESFVSGQITDSEGAVIANARVVLHWDPSGSTVGLDDNIGIKSDVIVSTDSSGKYNASVPPGFYDVFVSSPAFTAVAAKVRVKTGQSASFNAKLSLDPLVSKELAHEIGQRRYDALHAGYRTFSFQDYCWLIAFPLTTSYEGNHDSKCHPAAASG